MPASVIRIALTNREYPVVVSSSSDADFAEQLKKISLPARCMIVTQPGIWRIFRPKLSIILASCGISYDVFEAPDRPSEKAKSAAVLMRLIQEIAKADARGGSRFVLIVGGGVVGDLGGFAAGIYKRGIPLVQYPTTLTAQVDSAIGGKNAIDMPYAKNVLGCVYQPKLVFCDVRAVSTMPDSAFREGLAEVIKYGMIKSPPLLSYLEKNMGSLLARDLSVLKEVVAKCVRIKAQFIVRDEFDTKGLRAHLNFGHTFGHAMEAAFGFELTHGRAVAVGMMAAMALSLKIRCLKDDRLTRRLEGLLRSAGLPVQLAYSKQQKKQILAAMRFDKKWIHEKSRFIVLERAGVVRTVSGVREEDVSAALDSVLGAKESPKSHEGRRDRSVHAIAWLGKMLKPRRGLEGASPDRPAAAGEGLAALPPRPETAFAQKPIGKTLKYYPKIGVAIVKIERGRISTGDRVRFAGKATDFEQNLISIQENHKTILQAGRGKVVGIRVVKPVEEGDRLLIRK